MIGDIFLWLRTKIKQSFCVHDYSFKSMEIGLQIFTTKTCKKCNRMKTK